MSAKEPKSIQSVLFQQSPELAALRQRAEQHVSLRDSVADQLPEPLREHVVAASIEDSVLTVVCDSAPWASRLRFYSQTLLQNLVLHHKIDVQSVAVKVRPHWQPT